MHSSSNRTHCCLATPLTFFFLISQKLKRAYFLGLFFQSSLVSSLLWLALVLDFFEQPNLMQSSSNRTHCCLENPLTYFFLISHKLKRAYFPGLFFQLTSVSSLLYSVLVLNLFQ